MGIPEVEGKERREEENSGEWADFQQELTSIHRNNISGTGRRGALQRPLSSVLSGWERDMCEGLCV